MISPMKVARSSLNLRIILSYPLGLIWIFVYVLAAQTSAGQASPNSKQSAKGYERIIREILRRSGYFNSVTCLSAVGGIFFFSLARKSSAFSFSLRYILWNVNNSNFSVKLKVCNSQVKWKMTIQWTTGGATLHKYRTRFCYVFEK